MMDDELDMMIKKYEKDPDFKLEVNSDGTVKIPSDLMDRFHKSVHEATIGKAMEYQGIVDESMVYARNNPVSRG